MILIKPQERSCRGSGPKGAEDRNASEFGHDVRRAEIDPSHHVVGCDDRRKNVGARSSAFFLTNRESGRYGNRPGVEHV